MLSRHRQLNVYKMTTDFGHIPKYDVLDMFLRYKDKMHHKKVTMVYYNGHFLIRPLVTHFMECNFSTTIGRI